jgi:hypothetical protein
MIRGRIEDKEMIVEILEEAFQNNPAVSSYSYSRNGRYNLKPVVEYAFFYSLKRNGIFISNDRKIVAFLNNSKNVFSWMVILYQIRLMLFGIKFWKIFAVNNHYKKIKLMRGANEPFLHFWFLGTTQNNKLRDAHEFITELMALASQENLTIYAETSLEKNEKVYTRYGFKTFAEVKTPALNLHVRLMKLDAISLLSKELK